MKTSHKFGWGAAALVGGLGYLMTLPEPPETPPVSPRQAQLKFAAVTPSARQDVDYAALDVRLKRLAEKPAVVGLAVGIVENGRITFLGGYGEELAGSGQKVTAQTVFRWASVSKGVASTMVGKLAEEGKLSFHSPVAQYSASLKLPGGMRIRRRSRPAKPPSRAVCNALTISGGGATRASSARPSPSQPHLRARYLLEATRTSPMTARRKSSSGSPANFAEAVREYLFDPIGMTSASMSREGLRREKLGSAAQWRRKPWRCSILLTRSGGRRRQRNIKDLALWMVAQMGQMPTVLSPQFAAHVQAPLVKTPGERRRMRKFLERPRRGRYGYGWRSYNYAGHRIVGHRGGVSGYRSLICFDPRARAASSLVEQSCQPAGGLEFEVMDMVYRLPFRDWMELDIRPARSHGAGGRFRGGSRQRGSPRADCSVARLAPAQLSQPN